MYWEVPMNGSCRRSLLSTYADTTIARISRATIARKSVRWVLIARLIAYFPGTLLTRRNPRPSLCAVALIWAIAWLFIWDLSAGRPPGRPARGSPPEPEPEPAPCGCGPGPSCAVRSVIGGWSSHGTFG